MIDFKAAKEFILSLPGVEEKPHFDRTSFRVMKIFVTYDSKQNQMNFKFSEVEQDVFCKIDASFFPLDNKWGKQGWTTMDLSTVREEYFKDAVITAYCEAAPKSLVDRVRVTDKP